MEERGAERIDDVGHEQADGKDEQADGKDERERLGNCTWCQCDQCMAMPTVKESLLHRGVCKFTA